MAEENIKTEDSENQAKGIQSVKALNLQDTFLNIVRKERNPITIFLTNGFQMRGIVKGFDNYVVLLDVEGKCNMIYKHAISTIVPARNVDILSEKNG